MLHRVLPVGLMVLLLSLVSVAAKDGRDLSPAAAGSVGVSSERLTRLEAGLKRFVDEHRLAEVTTLLARRGKIVHTVRCRAISSTKRF